MGGIAPQGALVVITGAGSGIGRAIAVRYATHGATVVAADIDEASAKETATLCAGSGRQAFAYACDVADQGAVRNLAHTVEHEHGPVDIVVNNAGVGVAGSFLDTTEDDWTWLRSINLDGVAYGCRAFGESMVSRQHGQIVNIASGAAYLPNRRLASYCATKAAVVMLSRCLRADWAEHGVGVSVVCPGVIKTPILEHTRLRGTAESEKATFARGFKFAHSPDQVAKAVVKAASTDKGMVSVGIETQLGYHALRLAPAFNGLVARI